MGQDRGDDGVCGDSLHLRFGAELDPVSQGGQCQGLHVVGRDVVAAGEPGPGASGGEQGGGASRGDAEGERGGITSGTADIYDVARYLRGDGGLGDGGPCRFEVGGARDGAYPGRLEVAGVEAVRVAGQDADLVVARREGTVSFSRKRSSCASGRG